MKADKQEKRRKAKYQRSRGAVSVFLTIILVPCIITVCLFDDICRVQLSQAQAASAADLALHSLMADYDKDLKEKYGFVASSQEMGDEKYNAAENYYKGMMNAGSTSGNGFVYTYLKNTYGGSGEVSDFLKTDVVEDVVVSAAENGALGDNPALIEDGIVEFMKYRGIPELGVRLIDLVERITNADFLGDVQGSKEDRNIMDAKEEYGQKESELLEKALYEYIAILRFEKSQSSGGDGFPTAEAYTEIARKIRLIREDLKQVTDFMTKYYSEAKGLGPVEFPEIDQNHYTSTVTKDSVGDKQIVDGATVYYLHKDKYETLKKNLDDDLTEDLENLESAAQNIVNACNGIVWEGADTNPAIYYRRIEKAISKDDLKTINNVANHIMYEYAELKAARECIADPNDTGEAALPADWDTVLAGYMNRISSDWQKYLRKKTDLEPGLSVPGSTSAYNQLRKSYYYSYTYYGSDSAEVTVEKVRNFKYRFKSQAFDNQELTVSEFAKKVTDFIKENNEKIDKSMNMLDIAINGGTITINGKNKSVCGLGDESGLMAAVREKENALNNWDNLASGSSSKYAKGDQEQIEVIKNNSFDEDDEQAATEEMASKVDEESVRILRERLTGIYDGLKECKEGLDQITYGGQKLSTLAYAASYQACSVGDGNVIPLAATSMRLSENAEAAVGYSEQLIAPAITELYTFNGFTANGDGSGNDPALANHTPELYKYFKEKFGEEEKADEYSKNVDDAKDKLNELKEKAEKMKEGLFEMDGQARSEAGGTLPTISGGHTEGTYSPLTLFDSLIGFAQRIYENNLMEYRDQIYSVEYAMDMFTYQTLNNEGRYKIAHDKDNSVTFKDNYPYTDLDTGWNGNEKTEVYEDQSLTNYAFSTENNKIYLGEIEYLLFGKGDASAGAKTANGHIFTIREVVDLASAFVNFWGTKTDTGAMINGLANAISLATCGIVAPIWVKTGAIIALGTAEACVDLKTIKGGAPVTVYKSSEEQWKFALDFPDENDFKSAGLSENNEKVAPEDENGFYYSDYIYIFMLLMSSGSGLTESYQNMLLRIGDLVESNMGKNFDISKSLCYFKLSAGMQVKPLMLALPIANSDPDIDVVGFRSNAAWCQYNVNVVRGYS